MGNVSNVGSGAAIFAQTPPAGVALINGGQNLLVGTVPGQAGGAPVPVLPNATLVVSVLEVGGQITIAYTCGGVAKTSTLYAAAQAVGANGPNSIPVMCDPATTVTIAQFALTAGASILFAALTAV